MTRRYGDTETRSTRGHGCLSPRHRVIASSRLFLLMLGSPALACAADDLPKNGFENLAATGIAGLILAVVVIPILRWMFGEMKAQREAFTSYLSTHATREEALMSALQQEIKREADILQKIHNAHLLDTNIGLQDTRQEIRRLREVIGQLSLYVPRNQAPRGEHEPHT